MADAGLILMICWRQEVQRNQIELSGCAWLWLPSRGIAHHRPSSSR
jgi:hypothetical protein